MEMALSILSILSLVALIPFIYSLVWGFKSKESIPSNIVKLISAGVLCIIKIAQLILEILLKQNIIMTIIIILIWSFVFVGYYIILFKYRKKEFLEYLSSTKFYNFKNKTDDKFANDNSEDFNLVDEN